MRRLQAVGILLSGLVITLGASSLLAEHPGVGPECPHIFNTLGECHDPQGECENWAAAHYNPGCEIVCARCGIGSGADCRTVAEQCTW